MTRKKYNAINQMLVNVGEIALENESKRDIYKAGFHAGMQNEKNRNKNLYSLLNDLHLSGLKINALLNAALDNDCDLLTSMASDHLHEMLTHLEAIIYKCAAKEDAA